MAKQPQADNSFFDEAFSNRPTKADLRKARKTIKIAKQTSRYGSPLTLKTDAQREFLEALKENDVILASGGAGVGKTYISARFALQELLEGNIQRIIITRPMVPVSGESLGFLPGGVKEKTDPWTIPVIDAFKDGASKTTIDSLIKEGKIEFAPFAYIRGRTFNDAIVLADESQNLTIEQFKVLITRVGENCKIIVSGDIRQSDIRGKNGLDFAIRVAETCDVSCEIFEFEDSDVVRSKVVSEWVLAFNEYGEP